MWEFWCVFVFCIFNVKEFFAVLMCEKIKLLWCWCGCKCVCGVMCVWKYVFYVGFWNYMWNWSCRMLWVVFCSCSCFGTRETITNIICYKIDIIVVSLEVVWVYICNEICMVCVLEYVWCIVLWVCCLRCLKLIILFEVFYRWRRGVLIWVNNCCFCVWYFLKEWK